ncbi:MAG TPA: Fe-S cluster assembly protein SufD [Planctomycetota bacterium]|jgi:Fe-S cluster assembly protein SufD
MSNVLVNATQALSAESIRARADAAAEPAFLTERRLKALETYLTLPLPGRRDEIWRRVEFGPLDIDAATVRGPAQDIVELSEQSEQAKKAGVFWGQPEIAGKEIPEVLTRHWNTEVFPAGDMGINGAGGKFHALNQTLWEGGYVYHVPQGVEVELPVWATLKTRPENDGVFPHNLIVLDEGASATVIEEYAPGLGESQGLCCPQTEIILKKGARLRYILLQTIGLQSVFIGAHRAHQYADSKLTFVSAHLGSRLSKAFLATRLLEPKAEAILSGLYYGTQEQKLHMDTLQHHVAPECKSDLMFKGALDDKARAVYRGMIHLEPAAQKTDAYQQNRTLLLSDDARMDAIPGLEILANDVRCTHGAAAGQIDPTMLFYLMSRGLSRFESRKMIMDGFFEEVVLRFGLSSVIDPLRQRIDDKIGIPNPEQTGGRGDGETGRRGETEDADKRNCA